MDPMGPLDGGPCHGNSCVLVLALYFKKVTPKDTQKCTHKSHRVGLAHCFGAYICCTVAYAASLPDVSGCALLCVPNTILVHPFDMILLEDTGSEEEFKNTNLWGIFKFRV